MTLEINIIDSLAGVDVKILSKKEKNLIYKVAEKIAAYDLGVIESIKKPDDAVRYLQNRYRNYDHEIFGVVFLDNKHQVISVEEIFRGTIDGAAVYPREVVKSCIERSANACIFFHNHPAGCPKPSSADNRITKRLKDALALIDVEVLDHFILASSSYYSFAEAGEL